MRVLEHVARIPQVEPDHVQRGGHELGRVVPDQSCNRRELERLVGRREAADERTPYLVEQRRAGAEVRVRRDVEHRPGNHAWEEVVERDARVRHVGDFARRAPDESADHQRAVVLRGIRLRQLQRRYGAQRVAGQHHAARTSELRCEQGRQLVCAVGCVLEREPVRREAGGRDRKASRHERVAHGGEVVLPAGNATGSTGSRMPWA